MTEEEKTFAIGSDHAAFAQKEEMKVILKKRGYIVHDCGTDSEERCDYPDFAQKVVSAVLSGKSQQGLLLCGTGLGMSYAANRTSGIRGALCWSREVAGLARSHNDANVLILPGRAATIDSLEEILDAWLESPGLNGARHLRRIEMIDE